MSRMKVSGVIYLKNNPYKDKVSFKPANSPSKQLSCIINLLKALGNKTLVLLQRAQTVSTPSRQGHVIEPFGASLGWFCGVSYLQEVTYFTDFGHKLYF